MKVEAKLKAVSLRKQGFSLNEISEQLSVSKSSASLWVRDILLSSTAKQRLIKKIELGRYVSAENKKTQTRKKLDVLFNSALFLVSRNRKILCRKDIAKILCALMYWCEGYKNTHSGVAFTNSDPKLIAAFLKLMRLSFPLDEKKFRACIHIHPYHSEKKQIEFWSLITTIPSNQFIKSFKKHNGSRNIRKDYPGCLSVRYHGTSISRELISIGKAFLMGV